MGERRGAYKVFVGRSEGKKPEDLGVDGKIILKWICRKWDVVHGVDSCGSAQVVGYNGRAVSINCGEFLG
jgi:hypothetical protein